LGWNGSALRPQPRTRSTGNARERIRAQTSGDLLNVFMMPRLQRSAQLLREEIADQCDAPVPQHDALIEQSERGMSIALMARALGETRGG
jgi:hypothetical protein